MFDTHTEATPAGSANPAAAVWTSADLAELVAGLDRLDSCVSDTERIDQIRVLEELKSALAATQAKITAAFTASQEAAQEAAQQAGVKQAEIGTGVAAQIGLAKRESAFRARRYVGWANILTRELPHTYAALRAGHTTEWRAMLVARETAEVSVEHRAQVDLEIGPRLADWGDRQTQAETRRAVCRLDPHALADRARLAEADRRVTLRPAPDTMTVLSAVLPVAQGVAVYKALSQHADTARAAGETRGRGPLMADALVQRLTGQTTAPQVPVEVNLIMTDQTLLGPTSTAHTNTGPGGGAPTGEHEPAVVEGYGPIPAPLARRLLTEPDETTAVWLRRLYTDADNGQLVAMESTRRRFEHGLRQFLVFRDQRCRMPWCDAPIRHADHLIPADHGGPTSAANGQGLCEACNYAKQAPGWTTRPGPGGAGHSVLTTTPTGHAYTNRPPAPPGQAAPDRSPPELEGLRHQASSLERLLANLVLAS